MLDFNKKSRAVRESFDILCLNYLSKKNNDSDYILEKPTMNEYLADWTKLIIVEFQICKLEKKDYSLNIT